MRHVPPPPPDRRPWETGSPDRDKHGSAVGAGVVLGIVSPILIACFTFGRDSAGYDSLGLGICLLLSLPVILLMLGLGLTYGDTTRPVGVALMTAGGVWLTAGAGLCAVLTLA